MGAELVNLRGGGRVGKGAELVRGPSWKRAEASGIQLRHTHIAHKIKLSLLI